MDFMPTASVRSITALAKAGFDVVFAGGGGLPAARNSIAEGVLQQGYEALLAVDSDMVFLPEHAIELIRHAAAHDRKIVSGRYISRSTPHRPHAYVGSPPKPIMGQAKYDESVPVDYTGAGFLYVHADVFRGVERPWFDHSVTQGEDAYFCRKAAAAGFPTWYYPWVTLGHVGVTMYSDPQYEAVLTRR